MLSSRCTIQSQLYLCDRQYRDINIATTPPSTPRTPFRVSAFGTHNLSFVVPNSQLPNPSSQLSAPSSRLSAPSSQLSTPSSQLSTFRSQFPALSCQAVVRVAVFLSQAVVRGSVSRGPCFRVSWSVFPCLMVRVSVSMGAARLAPTMWVSVFFRVSVVRVSVSTGQAVVRVFPCFSVFSVSLVRVSVFQVRVYPCLSVFLARR